MSPAPRIGAWIGVLSACVIACNDNAPDLAAPDAGPTAGATDAGVDAGPPPLVGGLFSVVPDALPRRNEVVRSALGDCNGDGLLDVLRPSDGIVLEAKADGTYVTHELGVEARAGLLTDLDGDGKPEVVLAQNNLTIGKGVGDCTFEPDREIRWACPSGFALAMRVQDVDQDGLDDIIASCTGPPGAAPYVIQLARGDGHYEVFPIAGDGLDDAPKSALPVFNTFFHDLDGDGVLDGFFLSDTHTGWVAWGVLADVPTFVRDDAWTSVVSSINSMSLSPLDYDRDGRIELFGSGEHYTALLLGTDADRHLVDGSKSAGLELYSGALGDFWSALTFDADFDGWMDIFVLRKPLNLEPDDLHQIPGQPSLFLNQGDGAFVDAAAATPVLIEGIQMTCGDLRSEGRMSCFVDGDTTTTLLRNDRPAGHPWIGLRLQGTASGLSGEGAIVSVDGATPPRVYVAGTQAGTYTTHAPDLLFAANDNTTDITITWPSGVRQHVQNLTPNAYTTVQEPEVVHLSRRIAPADGTSTIDVTVDPKLVGASTAEVLLSGGATWLGEPDVREDGTVTRTLVAPTEASTTRLSVLLDGTPLRVRPRLRFE